MAAFNDGRPLTELIGSLAGDLTSLFRKEIQLAKAEASEKASEAAGGVAQIVIGAVVALGALGVLLGAAVSGLALVLLRQGFSEPAAEAIAALIVGVVVAAIAAFFVSRGLNTLKTGNLSLKRTANSLQRDAAAVKEKF